MSQTAANRRRRPTTEGWLAVCGRVESDNDELRDRCERVQEENDRLREQLAEVEGWYRLLQVDHASLQDTERRSSSRTTELQAELNRLAEQNAETQTELARLGAAGQVTQEHHEEVSMNRLMNVFRSVQRHRWAMAACVAIATLVARDAVVQGLFEQAISKIRHSAGRDDASRSSGFVQYAAMLNSRDQLERARRDYNAGEGKLKGDALLEAQDRLRAAKARDRQTRLAFLPELARQCEQAKVPVPREAAEALAALKSEMND